MLCPSILSIFIKPLNFAVPKLRSIIVKKKKKEKETNPNKSFGLVNI